MTFCGVLNIDKPAGVTSREVVDRIVRLARPAKVGHAGTLDPLATGVLVVCVGHATRLISLIQEGRKFYRGRFQLGLRSDTDDITGQLAEGGDWKTVTREQLQELLPAQTGQVQQVPPQFSAIHVDGRRAYDLARRGQTLQLDSRPVEIFRLKLSDFQPPEFELEIECGSGTYIRSIGRDLGTRLGCGAVMTQLRRMTVGPFHVNQAASLDELTVETFGDRLQPATCAVDHLPRRTLNASEIIAVRRGQSLPHLTDPEFTASENTVITDNSTPERRTALINSAGELLGIGVIEPGNGRLQPRIIFPA